MFKTLKTKLAFSHIAVVLTTAFFLGSISFWMIFSIHKNDTLQYLNKGATNGSFHIQHFIRHKELVLDRIADSEEISVYQKKYQDVILVDYLEDFSEYFDSISFISPDGQEEVKVINGIMSEDLTNYATNQQFLDAEKNHNQFIIKIDSQSTKDYPDIVFMLAKKHYFSDKLLFVLRATVSLENIHEYLVEFSKTTSDFLFITNKFDQIIIHPDKQMLGKKISLPKASGIGDKTHLGAKGIYSSQKIEYPAWKLINVIPYEKFLDIPYRYARSILLIFLVTILISLVAASFITRSLNKPLTDLTKAIKRVADGDRSYKLSPFYVGELDTLVKAFNKMNSDLAETTISKEYSDNILNSIKESLIVTSIDGTIESANKTTFDTLKCSANWLIGKSISEILPDDFDFDFFRKRRCPEEGIETTFKSVDNHETPTHFFYSILANKEGEKIGIVCLGLDISRRKKIEAEKDALTKKLHQAQRLEAVGTLASGIAHDFNNILTIIIGYCQILELTLEKDINKQSTKEILTASNRAKDLVRQLLDFSRQVEHAKISLTLHPVLKEITKMLKSSLPASIEIKHNISTECPPIFADPSQFQQLVMNLCNNAAQAMGDSGILTIEMSTKTISDEDTIKYQSITAGEYIQLSISDTGHGIKKENIERIFDPFFTTKGVQEGTGLGLAVVHGIVTKMNAQIFVESEENVGTTFTILIPPHIEGSPHNSQEVDLHSSFQGDGRHILFVDDEKPLADLGKNALEMYGFKVTQTTKPKEALEIFKKSPDNFDAVITDFAMPKLRGDNLLHEVHAIRSDIPVILCTGYHAQLVKVEEIGGTNKVIKKPYSMEEIASALIEILPEK